MYCILYSTALQLQFLQSHSACSPANPPRLLVRGAGHLRVLLSTVILSKSKNVFTQVAEPYILPVVLTRFNYERS